MIRKYDGRESRGSSIIRYQRNSNIMPDGEIWETIFSRKRCTIYREIEVNCTSRWPAEHALVGISLATDIASATSASREYTECCYKWPSLPFDTSRVSASWCVDAYAETPFELSELIYVRTNGQNRIHYCPSGTTTMRAKLLKSVFVLTRIISLDREYFKLNAIFSE